MNHWIRLVVAALLCAAEAVAGEERPVVAFYVGSSDTEESRVPPEVLPVVDSKTMAASVNAICEAARPSKVVVASIPAWTLNDIAIPHVRPEWALPMLQQYRKSGYAFAATDLHLDDTDFPSLVRSDCPEAELILTSSPDTFANPDTLYIVTSSTIRPVMQIIKRDGSSAFLDTSVQNSNDSKPFFLRKQLFSPGVFMGLIAGLFSLFVLVVGLALLAGIQTPSRFQEPPKLKKQ